MPQFCWSGKVRFEKDEIAAGATAITRHRMSQRTANIPLHGVA
jgi:hypothetical protein